MKRIGLATIAFLLAATIGSAQTAVDYLYEDFGSGSSGSNVIFDQYLNEDNEQIRRQDDADDWAWGARAAQPSPANAPQVRRNDISGNVWLDGGANAAGTRLYTRLDTTSDVATEACNTPAVVLDASGAGYGVVVNASLTGSTTLAVLIRDNGAWYQSSAIAADGSANLLSALQWQTVDLTAGTPGADMEEVDAGGELGALTFTDALGDATPTFDVIDGFGVVTATGVTGTTQSQINDILIANLATLEAPANVLAVSETLSEGITVFWDAVAGAAGYNVYSALATGGPYTQLNSSLITDTYYLDDTASEGTEAFYVVTAQANPISGESAQSAEASATVTLATAVDELSTTFSAGSGGEQAIDRYIQTNNENIQRQAAGEWAWGGNCSGGSGGAPQIMMTFGDGAIRFDNAACRAGSRIYTRLDTTTPTDADFAADNYQCNRSAVTLDASNGEYAFSYFGNGSGNMVFGLLLCQDGVWYQSSDLTPNAENMLADLDWYLVDQTAGSEGEEMNQVDDSGEQGALVVSGTIEDPAPVFDNIVGFGLNCTAGASTGDAGYTYLVDNFVLADVVSLDAPTNLVATLVPSPLAIDLAWDAVTDAVSYNVYRAEATGGPYTMINTAAVTATSYSDDTVEADVEYFYVVRAVAADDSESDNSNEDSATATPPAGVEDWRNN